MKKPICESSLSRKIVKWGSEYDERKAFYVLSFKDILVNHESLYNLHEKQSFSRNKMSCRYNTKFSKKTFIFETFSP